MSRRWRKEESLCELCALCGYPPEKATPPGIPIKRPFDTDSDTDPDPDLASPSSFSDDRW
ncbi:MAG: hypothetical protein ACOX52_17600 [Verrucomicrobiota bacterium]